MEQQREIGFFIKIIHDITVTKINARLCRYDITLAQSRVLRLLYRSNGPVSFKELGAYLQVKHSTLNGILGRLEAKSYVEITVSEQDRRHREVRLTEKGRQIHRQMIDQIREDDALLTRDFSEEEIATLLNLLSRIYHNIEGS